MFSERFEQALAFADRLHRKQRRKTNGFPYVAHLLGVAASVIEDGGSEEEAIAALLHDSIEDQARHYPGGEPTLAAAIESAFGSGVLELVLALTERPDPSEHGLSNRAARWRAHKEAYIRQIVAADERVRRISSADSLYNVRSLTRDYLRMGDEMWSRFLTRSRDDQLWAYDALAKALTAAGGGALAGELDRAVDDLYRVTGVRRDH